MKPLFLKLRKHKFIRKVAYKSDKSITITYIKRDQFNKDRLLLVNPDHLYNHKGFTTVVTTDRAGESINPLDFNSKYDVDRFKTAMNSKLISETFSSLKKNKIDMLTVSTLLNGLTFITIIYLLLELRGVIG
jgi:hypothetical protein